MNAVAVGLDMAMTRANSVSWTTSEALRRQHPSEVGPGFLIISHWCFLRTLHRPVLERVVLGQDLNCPPEVVARDGAPGLAFQTVQNIQHGQRTISPRLGEVIHQIRARIFRAERAG